MWSSAEAIQHLAGLDANNLEFFKMPNLHPEKGATISFHCIKYNVQVKTDGEMLCKRRRQRNYPQYEVWFHNIFCPFKGCFCNMHKLMK